jgi:hypothetical protein
MIRNKYINKAKDDIKSILIEKIELKYNKTTNKGRPNSLTISECLDAIFLCSY